MDPCDLTALEARDLIGRKSLSPVEVLESCIARTDAIDPAVNAIVARDDEAAHDGGADVPDERPAFLVAAVSASRPLVLVLDDLQWVDGASLELIATTLRACQSSPLFVVALARPEIHEQLARAWRDADVVELELRALTAGACDELVRDVLGDADAERRRRIIARAEGNAFFLEELVRAAAETLGMEICLPVWQHRAFIDAHRYDHAAVTTVLLVTTEETQLEHLIARKVAAGDIGAVANTIVVMGSERVGNRLGRFLCVVKHRGSAKSDEIAEYRVTERGFELG